MAVAEAAVYAQAHEKDEKEADFLIKKLSINHTYHIDLKSYEQRISEIHTHNYDRIARTFAFDAYEKINAFLKRIIKEQEASHGKHNKTEE